MDSSLVGRGCGGGFNPKGDNDNLESSGYHRNRRHSRHQYISGHKNRNGGNLLFSPSYETNHVTKNQNVFTAENSPSSAKKENKLKKMLRKAVMKDNKTVIITTLNEAWAEPNSIFDLFLESFSVGNGTQNLLKHVMVCTMDKKAYSRCLEENLHCYALISTSDHVNFSGEADFMSGNYMKMIWGRIEFLRTILEMGYDFIFTDADVMWFRDPFPRFDPDGDIQVSSDHYFSKLRSHPNGGFKYVKSNNRTIEFYKFWYKGREYFPWYHDQQVLNQIKISPFIQRIGLRLRFLETVYFGGFCEPSKDLNSVITMHANCCIGLKYKIPEMQSVIEDWKHYMSLPIHAKTTLSTTTCPWSLSRICANVIS
ncbi:hypothetical protein ACS0TY_011909 [Phlomoides rotata]